MFTGIIEATGIIENIADEGSNKHFYLSAPFTNELKIDQSVAHNGVCLTVVEIKDNIYKVSAIEETLLKTNLNDARKGDRMNLERCMPAHGRFDGHIVQGHVDTTAICKQVESRDGSWLYTFETQSTGNFRNLVVDKGSICVNGISLTVVKAEENTFRVAIIPYTHEFTNLGSVTAGTAVNIEFDILGKYVQKMLSDRGV